MYRPILRQRQRSRYTL